MRYAQTTPMDWADSATLGWNAWRRPRRRSCAQLTCSLVPRRTAGKDEWRTLTGTLRTTVGVPDPSGERERSTMA